jgi:FHA domain-containing protein
VVKITVVSARTGVQVQGLSAVFGVAGGTIGRAKTNQLVLDDPERTVSRIHAQIVSRGGTFLIVDQGSNPLLHNGQALGSGNEAHLSEGDRLQIGGFELSVNVQASQAAAAAAPGAGLLPDDMTMLPSAHAAAQKQGAAGLSADDDPFADLLAGLGGPSGEKPSPAPVQLATSKAAMPSALPAALDDPMGTFSGLAAAPAKASGVDPFDDLLDFGTPAGGKSAAPGAQNTDVLGSLPTGQSSSIDELFGLSGTSAGADPFGASPLAAPLMQPNTASSVDPLQALQAAPAAPAQARGDHVSVLQQAYVAPKVVTPMPPPTPPAPAPSPRPAQPVSTNPLLQPAHSAPAQLGGSASEQELLAAFLRGAKTSNNMPTQLTPALMERLGALLHTATNGTLQLLMSRQELKQGFRSEVTMIMAEANNPLKFSPNAEIALAHLLGPKARGFMDAEHAMSNAYADLRAHQFGVMVGMKAALAHVLEQFTPDRLEGKLAEKSKLDAIFTSGRKAKLWDLFCQLYSGIAAEAEDDFHALFGKAFSKAYDEQMARFKGEK